MSQSFQAEIDIDRILNLISGIASNLGTINTGAWRNIAVDNIVLSGATAPTVTTITSTSVDVSESRLTTVYVDVTGATTGVLLTFRGGNSGFGMMTLRAYTAVAGMQAFTIGDLTTGATSETNAITRLDDILVQATLAANTGASTGVTTTIRTRFLTQP